MTCAHRPRAGGSVLHVLAARRSGWVGRVTALPAPRRGPSLQGTCRSHSGSAAQPLPALNVSGWRGRGPGLRPTVGEGHRHALAASAVDGGLAVVAELRAQDSACASPHVWAAVLTNCTAFTRGHRGAVWTLARWQRTLCWRHRCPPLEVPRPMGSGLGAVEASAGRAPLVLAKGFWRTSQGLLTWLSSAPRGDPKWTHWTPELVVHAA